MFDNLTHFFGDLLKSRRKVNFFSSIKKHEKKINKKKVFLVNLDCIYKSQHDLFLFCKRTEKDYS